MSIRRLNHAVLYVRNARASADFYTRVLGFRVRAAMGDQAFFLQAEGSQNDHDLGLFQVGERPAGPHTVGLYHLAWQVQTLEELADLRQRLLDANSLVGESDHGVSRSLYARDPDGLEFESRRIRLGGRRGGRRVHDGQHLVQLPARSHR